MARSHEEELFAKLTDRTDDLEALQESYVSLTDRYAHARTCRKEGGSSVRTKTRRVSSCSPPLVDSRVFCFVGCFAFPPSLKPLNVPCA